MVTETVGGTTFGYCATGRPNTATAPISTSTMASTLASTGRSMKNFEITFEALRARHLAATDVIVVSVGDHLLPGNGAAGAGDDDTVVRL